MKLWNDKPIPIMHKVICILLLITSFLLWPSRSEASEFEAIGPCDNCLTYLGPGVKKWEGEVQVFLNNEGSPHHRTVARGGIERAIRMIKIYIDIDLVFARYTEKPLLNAYISSRQNTIIYGFEEMGFLGSAWIWWDWRGSGKINTGEIKLSPTISEKCINGVALHEMVHALFIGHSDTQNSIMAATPYRTCEYQSILRLDDIIALQSLYPAKPNRQAIQRLEGSEVCEYVPEVIFEGNSYSYESCTDDIFEIVEN